MDSSPTDKVLLNGVATVVHDLVEFSPVHELFQTHLQLWRKENGQIVAHRRKLESQLATYWRDEPHAPDPVKDEHWPARRIYSPDRTKSGLFPIPPELHRELNKYCDPLHDQYTNPIHYHLLRSLDDEQDFSTTESFVLLAELHDAAYSKHQLGYAEDFIVDVAEAASMLAKGMSQVAVQNLATLVERVLDLIEARTDSKSRNKTGKTLQQIVQRSRVKLDDLVIRSRPHSVTPSSLMIPESAAVGSSLESVAREFAKATERVPDEYKEQGRECGPLEGGKTALAKAVTRNPKAKPDDLQKHHGGKVFVREISKRKLEVFFRSFREFHAAKERLTSANSE